MLNAELGMRKQRCRVLISAFRIPHSAFRVVVCPRAGAFSLASHPQVTHDTFLMPGAQHDTDTHTRRGLLARPLDAFVFLLPLIIFYELTSLTRHQDRVIAFDVLRRFFELFGHTGMWAPGLGVIAILLATHLASGEKWSVRWGRVGLMYVEAAALAVPLLALNWAVPLAAWVGGTVKLSRAVNTAVAAFPDGPDHTILPLLDRMALGIGAGIYEELVFRLVLISLVVMIGVDLLRLRRTTVAAAAVALSSLAFAAHHHPPIGTEPFDLIPFTFRTIAGVYLALVFWYRGYGPAAGCHAAYNVALACLGSEAP